MKWFSVTGLSICLGLLVYCVPLQAGRVYFNLQAYSSEESAPANGTRDDVVARENRGERAHDSGDATGRYAERPRLNPEKLQGSSHSENSSTLYRRETRSKGVLLEDSLNLDRKYVLPSLEERTELVEENREEDLVYSRENSPEQVSVAPPSAVKNPVNSSPPPTPRVIPPAGESVTNRRENEVPAPEVTTEEPEPEQLNAAQSPAIASSKRTVSEPGQEGGLSSLIVNDFRREVEKEKARSLFWSILKGTLTVVVSLLVVLIILRRYRKSIAKFIARLKKRKQHVARLREELEEEKSGTKENIFRATDDLVLWKREGKPDVSRGGDTLEENREPVRDFEYRGELGFHELVEKKVEQYFDEHPELLVDGRESPGDRTIREVLRLHSRNYNRAYIARQTGLTLDEIDIILSIGEESDLGKTRVTPAG